MPECTRLPMATDSGPFYGLQIVRCSECDKPATKFTGHFHLNDGKGTTVISGTCSDHHDSVNAVGPTWTSCRGWWRPELGLTAAEF